ncbi:helix-turn-helix domain-containing protein (plasmid) [Clostridium perfringens]
MGFKKVDCISEKNKIMKEDQEIRDYIEEFDREYELMQSIVKARKKIGLTQKEISKRSGLTQQMVSRMEKVSNSPTLTEISKRSGLTQQMVSRMEKVSNSPTLTNFLRYISALGLDIDVKKKKI